MGEDARRKREEMKRIAGLVFIGAVLLAGTLCAQEYEKIEIKQGMYEDNVNERFGQPELSEDINPGFFPIPRKKALYKIGGSDYMILYFYSKRVNKITILSDVDQGEALAVFADK
jgi:hypothetical protein